MAIPIALIVGMSALAQTPAARFQSFADIQPSHSSRLVIATNDAVQQELRTTADLTDKLRQLHGRMQAALQSEYTSALPLKIHKLREIRARVAGEFDSRLRDLLSESQLQRLSEIQIQAQGDDAIFNPDVAEALALSEDQRAKLVHVQSDYVQKLEDLNSSMEKSADPFTPYQRPKVQMQIALLKLDVGNKRMMVLSAAQQEKLAELAGRPFDTNRISAR